MLEHDFFAALRRLVSRRERCASPPSAPVTTPPAANPSAPQPEQGLQPRTIARPGLELIKRFEGCARLRPDGQVEAYPDPGTGGAPWTIGWGSTGPGIVRGTVWTMARCNDRLAADLDRYAAEVRLAIGSAPTTQGQFDALVSFHYNTGAIARATLTRLHNAGDHAGAAREFGRWVFAAGTRLKGLARRRAAEAALYNGA